MLRILERMFIIPTSTFLSNLRISVLNVCTKNVWEISYSIKMIILYRETKKWGENVNQIRNKKTELKWIVDFNGMQRSQRVGRVSKRRRASKQNRKLYKLKCLVELFFICTTYDNFHMSLKLAQQLSIAGVTVQAAFLLVNHSEIKIFLAVLVLEKNGVILFCSGIEITL